MVGNVFILIISVYFIFVYYVFVFVFWKKMVKSKLPSYISLISNYLLGNIGADIYVGITHVAMVMMVLSFFTVLLTDPGQVPLHWGFYLDAPEHKKRRYCLICHIFKPERCHHCSACNRCVLNMDHHCPWINNCIGF